MSLFVWDFQSMPINHCHIHYIWTKLFPPFGLPSPFLHLLSPPDQLLPFSLKKKKRAASPRNIPEHGLTKYNKTGHKPLISWLDMVTQEEERGPRHRQKSHCWEFHKNTKLHNHRISSVPLSDLHRVRVCHCVVSSYGPCLAVLWPMFSCCSSPLWLLQSFLPLLCRVPLTPPIIWLWV